MSFDRYQLVSDAIKYNRRTTSRKLCYSIIPAWVISLLSAFIIFTIFIYLSNLFTTEPCSRSTYILYVIYFTGLFIYDYLFPLGILIFLNLAIYIKLVIRSKQFMNQKRCGGGKTKNNIPVISGMEEERQNRDVTSPPSFAENQESVAAATTKEDALSNETSKKKMETTEKNNSEGQGSVNVKTLQKAGRQLFTLVSVFVVCWFPLHLVLLLSISNSWSWAGNELWYYVPHVFLASNSAINPFLYLKVCRRYRVQVLHIISQVRKN
ncbi:Alpha-2C adrenergic receptor [Holothuria leucospilota]|uniref:Alpha-2C adrenergic receptor n=1 Tax=Holothuria leucospilota TaxID=206669 RepID=A0A9Q1CL99_HOLLE|nr:Alpha-2C adrenergic receptor [Holothuria leucospilota]